MILYTSVNSVLKADRIGIENMFCFSSELEQPGGKSGSFNVVLFTNLGQVEEAALLLLANLKVRMIVLQVDSSKVGSLTRPRRRTSYRSLTTSSIPPWPGALGF